ncbi:MAG: redox-regulated ATPase YchF [Candidatus Berkelbacteria bacterium]|nr:redox-regulated ATPase YchF [Candidatus Berkelbacteria bacterium]
MNMGIVGLPNVGKSSLFNALTKAGAQASNFPFTTIEPNVGIVSVPDERLEFLTKTFNSAKTVPATIKFVDIAGLVKGASQGEGLGNKFLSHIRSVDAIAEVVRVFDDPNVIHVHGGINPDSDISTINTELLLADLEVATKSLERLNDQIKKQDKEAITLKPKLERALELFNNETPLRTDPDLVSELRSFQFLTAKPLMYIANVSDQSHSTEAIQTHADKEGAVLVAINVKAELEVIELPEAEQDEYRSELDIKSGLNEIITAGYELLGLITFFTAGPKESHAWTITKNTKAPQAAGKIHTDFEKGFIRAQIYNVEDLKKYGSEKAIRDAGRLRSEGKEYTVTDGDVVEFLFNV